MLNIFFILCALLLASFTDQTKFLATSTISSQESTKREDADVKNLDEGIASAISKERSLTEGLRSQSIPDEIVKATKFPWIVYYNDAAPASAFDSYNPIVFHYLEHPPLAPLLEKKKEVLGYLDLVEVSKYDPWFSLVKERGLLIHENPNWPGDWLIDIRDPYWKQLVIDKIIPGILSQGFTGLFIDQLDVVIDQEKKEPQKFKGLIAAAIDLIKTIKLNFPRNRLMINRAYEMLPDIGNETDYVLAETLYTSYDFKTKLYSVRPANEFEWQLAQLNAARTSYPHIVIFSLDYWDPADKEMYKKIYATERGQCIRPYVSTIALDQIIPE